MTTTTFDQYVGRIEAGERLAPDVVRELVAAPDILPLGMLADTLRRKIHGTRATFVRVASCAFDASFADAVPPAAREVRITGAPESLEVALSAVRTARAIAGARAVSGFGWADVVRFSNGGRRSRVLKALHEAGLDAIAVLPLDALDDPAAALGELRDAGFGRVRLTIDKMAAADRLGLLLQLDDLQARFGGIEAINPLPLSLNAFRPTTGYEDVKIVAAARLAAPGVPHIQVDWQRYGPKLAQVALTFGADDIDNISASDDTSEGRRRAPIEEIRRNIRAAGFEPTERDGHFAV
jgi:aminodeoxyfutalosine synthase